MANIYLYAELLLNIRQVTVFAILPSNSNESTHVQLCDDHRTLWLTHDGEKATIALPSFVEHNSNLNKSNSITNELSFRLGVGSGTKWPTHPKLAFESEAPWPATKLSSQTRIKCQSCDDVLIEAGDVTIWKDLPSGGWADMMDFWHCHKPNPENGPDVSCGDTKGYSASNIMGPVFGTGLVDTSQFWFDLSQRTEKWVWQFLSPLLFDGVITSVCFSEIGQ